MKKSEIVAIICVIFSMILITASSIYVFYQLKPANSTFAIEKLFL